MNGACGWFGVSDSCASAPQWAALIAIANSMRVSAKRTRLSSTSKALYSAANNGLATTFLGVTQGTNGMCDELRTALVGYDYLTGLGSPRANVLIPALAAY